MPRQEELLYRFNLTNGQTRDDAVCKSCYWFVGDERFGKGDLNESDIRWIQLELREGEEFACWLEYHGQEFRAKVHYPIFRITNKRVMNRQEILDEMLPD